MKKNKTPSFILELPLKVSKKDEKELLSRFESARQLYNAILGEAKKRCFLVKQSKLFQQARKLSKDDKSRKELFQKSKDAYDFNDYSLQEFIGILRHNLKNNLDIHTVQKLSTRAFHAVEKIIYAKSKKVRFKSYGQLKSVESKSNDAGIRWREQKIKWNGLSLNAIINYKDKVIKYGLEHKVKYCRLLKKIIKGKNYFYVQLILEGKPFIKDKNQLGKGTVCFDFGPSTVAIVSKDDDTNKIKDAKLVQFCPELENKEKETRILQRKIDKQRRLKNPNNYNENGTIKKGKHAWEKSNRQLENEFKLSELHRKTAAHRKSLQGKLINEILRMGDDFKTEKVSRKWLQSLFGKSVGFRSPGMYVSGMKRKAESAGVSFMEFSTQTTKLSQTCFCGRQHKKLLSDRVHDCECGVHAQRDLFSAYEGLFVERIEDKDAKKGEEKYSYIFHADQAQKAWSSADTFLQVAWRKALQSTNRGQLPSSFGCLKDIERQSGSLVKDKRAKFEVQDVVLISPCDEESLKENDVFLSEPTGIYPL